MNISRLRLITFDVTDTLLKFRLTPGQQYGDIGAMYGILCDNNNLTQNFVTNWKIMKKEHPNFGLHTLGWECWWKNLVVNTFKSSKLKQLPHEEKKLEAIACHLIEVYKTSACWQHAYGVLDLLAFLRDKGVPLGIISNFDPRCNSTLVNNKLRRFFKFVLTSYEVGVEKPDPVIFQEAMNASKINNLKPEECLHIGDTLQSDYIGAMNSGWHGILVYNKDKDKIIKSYPDFNANHMFDSLHHLHKHLIKNNK